MLIIRRYCRYPGGSGQDVAKHPCTRHKKDGLVPNIISANTERSWNEIPISREGKELSWCSWRCQSHHILCVCVCLYQAVTAVGHLPGAHITYTPPAVCEWAFLQTNMSQARSKSLRDLVKMWIPNQLIWREVLEWHQPCESTDHTFSGKMFVDGWPTVPKDATLPSEVRHQLTLSQT